MTEALKNAFDQASALSDQDQNFIAAIMLEEMRSGDGWKKEYEESGLEIDQLAHEAHLEHLAGKTIPLDPDKL
ncbi:hypothetical protein [Adhaeretor mobilis]|uniref:Uncharacterized protein n=1 Tax=Adhaeretor mobilis TaxID=1930276 RepID=A0A517N223_9BACT|nr:hypothetical protein [Adhaeretor mobilis]QDT01192.1 hypothetical protein HG15A2_45340 [Adhaeretor mobilis]